MHEVEVEVEMKLTISRTMRLTDEQYEDLKKYGTIPNYEEIKGAMLKGGCEFETPEFDYAVWEKGEDGITYSVVPWND